MSVLQLRATILLTLLMGAAVAGVAAAQAPSPVTGDWDGALKVPAGIEVPLTLHLRDAGSTIDSPDQNAAGVPVSLTRDKDQWVVDIPASRARFTGALSADGQSLDGTFVQGGASLPAHFTRRAPGAPAPVRDRPQTPRPPYPYLTQEASFLSGAGVRLAGTLSLPPGKGPFPAVVMIAGSGPQNRDETIEGHKPFAVIADRLTRAGIAVLRYDKRGVGGSSGSYTLATGSDFGADAEAAVAWLHAQPGIAEGKLGLIGHSEGAEIAPSVANADPRVAFVVLLSAPGVSGARIIASQQRAILYASGLAPAVVEGKAAVERQLLAAVVGAHDAAGARTAARDVLVRSGMPADRAAAEAEQVSSPWYREFLDDNPAPALRRLKKPVLVVAGSKDLQVLPDLNLPVIRDALAGNADARIVELDGLNHLLQPATTGAPSEYGTITTTVAPAALDLIVDWVVGRTR